MGEPVTSRGFVVVLLGSGVQEEVIQHTLDVLTHFDIDFQVANWKDNGLPNLLAHASSEAGVVVFGTGIAYTDEHFPSLPEDIHLPIIKVVTGSPPVSGQLLTDTPFVMMAGFGINGAINAGLLAARILARSNDALRNLLETKPYPVTPPA